MAVSDVDGEPSFNPCFDGSVERGHDVGGPLSTLPVSILVLMEVLREVQNIDILHLLAYAFQSLF